MTMLLVTLDARKWYRLFQRLLADKHWHWQFLVTINECKITFFLEACILLNYKA